MILVEKHRPSAWADIIGLDSRIPTLCANLKDCPHFLFIGPAGTGKTTTARVVARSTGADLLTLNASDERGIDTVRDKVKSFAMTQSTNGKRKMVLLDEADGLSNDAQQTLRNLMESFATNCFFVLTANFEHKIIEPLRSRCVVVRYNNIAPADVLARLRYIVVVEGYSFADGTLERVVANYGADVRKSVNVVQELGALGRVVVPDDVGKNNSFAGELWALVKLGDFIKARQAVLNERPDEHGLVLGLYDAVMKDEALAVKNKMLCVRALANAQFQMHFVISKELCCAAMLQDLMTAVRAQ